MKTLINQLRTETQSLHLELHKNPLMHACETGEITKEQYIHILQSFYKSWQKIEHNLQHFPIATMQEHVKERFKALQSDLLKLGVVPDTKPEIQSLDAKEQIGIAYVLVGSSMGATQLKTTIQEALGEVPMKYFSMSPKAAGWPQLFRYLNATEAQENDACIAAANQTFQNIQSELLSFQSLTA